MSNSTTSPFGFFFDDFAAFKSASTEIGLALGDGVGVVAVVLPD
jgi:hypothetical protein